MTRAVILIYILSICNISFALYPVVLIPGYIGSQIEASLNDTFCHYNFCSKNSDWFTIFFDLRYLMRPLIDWFVDKMRLVYDRETGLTRNRDGVNIRIPGFGDTKTVEHLDPDKTIFSSYYAAIVNRLVRKLTLEHGLHISCTAHIRAKGYERGKSIHGAPYDFRKSPFELEEYFESLKNLIESTYQRNEHKPVVLIGHSMGGNNGLFFLQNQSSSWKSKYIKSFITLGTPWIGVVQMIRSIVSGDNNNINVIDPQKLTFESPSTVFLLPSPEHWDNKEVLIYGAKRNYTVNDLKQIFEDIGYEDGLNMWTRMKGKYDPTIAPDVESHIIYSTEMLTPIAYIYKTGPNDWYNRTPVVLFGDGDGSCTTNTLKFPIDHWKQTSPVFSLEVKRCEHVMLLSDTRAIDEIERLIRSYG
ncbi:hypothetical protein ACOME3_001151 [Neoechinorhynchus agilis]